MIKIAVLGFGTVGTGVAQVLELNGGLIEKRLKSAVEIKYILDVREFPDSPYRDRIIHDFSQIEQDHEVSIVVETIGGAGIAREFTERALAAGKSVVTSNKELVASHGYELLELAKKNNVNYLFEASVGGGIPILRPLSQCLAANEIEEIYGILNGTTNYILTRMVRAGATFDEALKEAQEKGYAEKDPTADVEGQDACRKICILGALAFGHHIPPAQVPAEGISSLAVQDVHIAETAHWRVKLLGRAVRGEDGKVRAYVAPHLVRESNPIAGVEDVFNAISVRGNAIGDVLFYGRGAGKLPTASAVVADVIDAAQHAEQRKDLGWGPQNDALMGAPEELAMRFYLRAKGTAAELEKVFGSLEILSEQGGETAAMSEAMTVKEFSRRAAQQPLLAQLRVLE